jgi:hypothetical protein
MRLISHARDRKHQFTSTLVASIVATTRQTLALPVGGVNVRL